MSELKNLQPERVFHYFEQITQIPHGSGDMDKIASYCVNFAKERNLYVRQDEYNNVVIKKPASKGYENKPAVIIQGHLDKVAQKDADSSHDFMKDPIELIVDGDFITANKTTLGADDGIAVAVGLALLDDSTINHPELEVIFTSDEETGIQVYIGNESSIESMKDCSLVTATYKIEDGVYGKVGIIGPKRMDYEKVVEALQNLKGQLDDIFKDTK